MTYHVCVFEGDDAAPEAVRPTVDVLGRFDLELVHPPVADHAVTLDEGTLPGELRRTIEEADTVLFGSARDRHLPIIHYLRRQYGGGTFANVRPVVYYPGANSPLSDPAGIDYTIVRENLQGLYARIEGEVSGLRDALSAAGLHGHDRLAAADPGTYAIRAHGEEAIRRFAEFACEYASTATTEATRLTVGTKRNVLPRTDGLFDDIFESVAAEYGAVEYDHLLADDMAQQLVINPHQFDVIATPNIFGDVLSDLGAGTVGGLGLAPSGCYGEDVAYFEPVHGTAPDIAGEGIINPTAMLLSAAMLLDYLGLEGDAADVRRAVVDTYAAGDTLTPDQGGSASTEEFAAAVAGRL